MKQLILVSSIVAILFTLACETTEDGCLDLLSSNYSIHSVSACDSCCTYPTTRFNFRVDYDTFLSRGLLDTFFLDNMDTFFLNDIKLSFTNFLFSDANESYQIRDSVRVGTDFVSDDYLFVDGTGSYNVGDCRFAGETKNISFDLGEDAEVIASYKPFDEIDQSSNLDELIDSMYINVPSQLAMIIVELQLADSIRTLQVSAAESIPLSYSVDIENSEGEPLIFNIRVDVAKLLGEDNSNNTDEELEATIARNLSAAIRID